MLKRELERAKMRGAYNPAPEPLPEMKAISPQAMALLGGAADIAATYTGLKRDATREENASMDKGSPARTALALALDLGKSQAVSRLARKLIPKSGKVMDAIDANAGAKQLSLAGRWGELMAGDKKPRGGFEIYVDRHTRGRLESQKRSK